MNIYQTCPTVENKRFLLRPVTEEDCNDLLKVYSDPLAVPLFNSDNCNGDDFYYKTLERMGEAVRFWIWSYENGWFVRWSIVDKITHTVIGTIELCTRPSEDGNDGCIILRPDLRSDYETPPLIAEILSLIVPPAYSWLGCKRMLTKAKPTAWARGAALRELGFTPSPEPLIGHDGTAFGDYWIRTI